MDSTSRQHAIHRIRARGHFAVYVVFYLALSTYFVVDWAGSDNADFWPVWPLLGGAIGLIAQASHLFGWQMPIAEERIQRELDRSL